MTPKVSREIKILRKHVAELTRRAYDLGLVMETEGNVSARVPGTNWFAITPSRVPRYKILLDDILVLDFEENTLFGGRNPSIETKMHLTIYQRRGDVGAIVHTHPTYATAVAAVHGTIPPFLEEQIPFLGGEIQTAKYALPGSQELANSVAEALGEKNAVLLANHGALTCARSLDEAFNYALLLEKAAKIYVLSKFLGETKLLPRETVAIEREMFQNLKRQH